ncbi:hypothetical protein HG443_001115 [Candidatus Saccharibacteria bacterium]|nr:hypothetical protein [Candidatus Saccharibacteria bacterium]
MSETVKVGRNRPPQNGWASKEEVAELRAEVAELRETNQAMLEEIKGLRAELGGAKRRHLLGAVATSAAAFFGKFFHRGEDLGDIPEKKLGKRENKRGAHAKGKEKEKEKGGTPIASARRDEKSKISREKEDKRNKGKHPLAKKVAVFALAATIIGGAIAGISQCSSHDIKGSDAAVTMKAGNEDLENPAFGSTQASAEENDAAKAEADLQNKANEMGISVESMKRLADEHGMPYDKIGTDEAQHYLSDQLLAKNNIAEPFDASTPETAKESLSFYIFNHKDVCAEFYAALHENPEGEVDGLENPQDTIDYSEQFKNDPAAFDAARKEVIGALNEDGTKVTVREATDRDVITYHKTHEEGSDNGTLGVGENKENSNGMNEKVVETNFTNRGIEVWTKAGCAQDEAPVARVVRKATATPKQAEQEVVQREEYHQKERQSRQYSWNRQGGEEEHRQNDSKDPKANDTQQNADKNFEANAKANDDAPTYGGQKNPDASAKSGNTDNNPDNGSEAVPDDKNGSIGGKQDAKPGQQDWGGGGGAADSGQDKTAVNPGDQGGLGKDTTGSNQTDSGNGSEETNRKSSSQHRSSRWEEGGSETIDENGNVTRKSHSSASDTGWVNDNNDDTHSGGNQVNDDVELQLRSSVPISQED